MQFETVQFFFWWVPAFGVSRNQTLLVGSSQDGVILAEAFESLRFPLSKEKAFPI